jgi:hypothetical protein
MKSRSINWIVIFILTVGLFEAACGQTSGEFPVPLSDPNKRAKLKAHLNTGSITVRGTARKDILVKYKSSGDDKKSSQSKDGLRRISGGTMDLEVSENTNYVKIGSNSWNNQIDLDIEVPSGIDLRVEAYNDGDIFVSNIQGEVELKNYNGEISADGVSGTAVAATYNGDIRIKFDKVTPDTPLSYNTYNGDIDLTLPGDIKASLKMKTDQGEIYTGFDINMVKSGPITKTETKSGTYKVKIDDWVRGDINGGGPEFSMSTYNGDIKIRKK